LILGPEDLSSKPGQLLTNAELIRHAWPDTFVDETNLRVHIYALRRALGDTKQEARFISNIPGRGYRFVAEVGRRKNTKEQAGVEIASPAAAVRRQGGRIVGRAEVLDQLARQLDSTRLLTIVRPGGIGKSTVARALLGRVSSEVIWVDLAELGTGHLIPTEIASKLNILTRTDDIHSEIGEALEGRELIIGLLDGWDIGMRPMALLYYRDRRMTPG
jgi:DNA-binding winged helix-turn-helix (wHTH) protein